MQYPDEAGLLSLEPFEKRDYKSDKKKIGWLISYFAPKYGITTWKRSDFVEMNANKLYAVWTKYYRLDKTAAQIANQEYIAPEERDNSLSIGEWTNPYLPPVGPKPDVEPDKPLTIDTQPSLF